MSRIHDETSEFYKRALKRANDNLIKLLDDPNVKETDLTVAAAKIKVLEDEKKEKETIKLLERHNEDQDRTDI